MLFQPVNFLGASANVNPYEGLSNFLPNILKGYYEPKKAKVELTKAEEDVKKRVMENALLQEFGKKEKEAELRHVLARAGREEFYGGKQYQGAELAKILGEANRQKFYSSEPYLKAELEKLIAEGKVAGKTTAQREAEYAYPGDEEAQREALRREQFNDFGPMKTEPPAGTPKSVIGRSAKEMNKAEWNNVSKEMGKDLTVARGMMEGTDTLNKIEKIIKDNPHMWKDLSFVYANTQMGDEGVVEKYLANNIVNKHDLAQAQKLKKLVAQFTLEGANVFGSNTKMTDAKFQTLKDSKLDIEATPEALMFNINSWKDRFAGGKNWHDALIWGKKEGREILRDDEAFKAARNAEQAKKEAPGSTKLEEGQSPLSSYSNYKPPVNETPEQKLMRLNQEEYLLKQQLEQMK